MRVIFTCGGTAGHVNPALALAGYMKEKDPETAVLFVGTPTGMERELVAKAGYDYAAVEVSSFQRKLDAAGIRHNLHTVRVLASSGRQARAILRDFKPDLVVGTGGYAFHGPYEHITAEGMDAQTNILVELVRLYSQHRG